MSAIQDSDIPKILTKQRDLCESLLNCSKRQLPLIDSEQYSELREVISLKQRLLEQWEVVKRERPQFVRTWQVRKAHLSSEDRNTCETLIVEIEKLYEQLLTEEQQGIETLMHRRDQTQSQLQGISNGARAQRAYLDNLAPATHRHIDVGQ
jgi:hypothetical protein